MSTGIVVDAATLSWLADRLAAERRALPLVVLRRRDELMRGYLNDLVTDLRAQLPVECPQHGCLLAPHSRDVGHLTGARWAR